MPATGRTGRPAAPSARLRGAPNLCTITYQRAAGADQRPPRGGGADCDAAAQPRQTIREVGLSERLCVVTGTSSGLGKAVAQQLLAKGWRVLGVARRDAALGEGYQHVPLDLGDLGAVESYFRTRFPAEARLAEAGRVGLVNNAGVLEPVAPLWRLEMDALARAYTVNTVTPMWLMGFFLAQCAHAPLRIVNVSSGAAHHAYAGWGSYCSTKAALRMAGMALAEEGELLPGGGAGARDVALLSYEPGIVDTEMQGVARSRSEADFPDVQRFRDFHSKGLLAPPEQPAAEIVAALEADGEPLFSERRFSG